MTRDIERRLQKLESQVPRQPTEQEELEAYRKFLVFAVAYYLGDPTPEGAPIEAFRRALGYQHSYDFQKACDANDPDLGERMRQATTKLLAKFGVSWEHEWDEILEAFNRMEAGFSERYRAGCR